MLTQVSIHGSYFPDIFTGLLLCGLGIGLAFVTATVGAPAGVAAGIGLALALLLPDSAPILTTHAACGGNS